MKQNILYFSDLNYQNVIQIYSMQTDLYILITDTINKKEIALKNFFIDSRFSSLNSEWI